MIEPLKLTVKTIYFETMSCLAARIPQTIGEFSYKENGEKRFLTGILGPSDYNKLVMYNTSVSIKKFWIKKDSDNNDCALTIKEKSVSKPAGTPIDESIFVNMTFALKDAICFECWTNPGDVTGYLFNDCASDAQPVWTLQEEDDDNETVIDYSEMSLEQLMLHRLQLESGLKYDHPDDYLIENFKENNKANIEKIKAAGLSDEKYEELKNLYIKDRLSRMKASDYTVFDYQFAGIGAYTAVLLKEEVPSFKCWINICGSAFLGDERDATEEDLIQYICTSIEFDEEESEN